MPYIKNDRRERFKDGLKNLNGRVLNCGELNYVLSRICLDYLANFEPSYQRFCEVEGVLSHVSKELYRREVSTYEDKKRVENGDIK